MATTRACGAACTTRARWRSAVPWVRRSPTTSTPTPCNRPTQRSVDATRAESLASVWSFGDRPLDARSVNIRAPHGRRGAASLLDAPEPGGRHRHVRARSRREGAGGAMRLDERWRAVARRASGVDRGHDRRAQPGGGVEGLLPPERVAGELEARAAGRSLERDLRLREQAPSQQLRVGRLEVLLQRDHDAEPSAAHLTPVRAAEQEAASRVGLVVRVRVEEVQAGNPGPARGALT